MLGPGRGCVICGGDDVICNGEPSTYASRSCGGGSAVKLRWLGSGVEGAAVAAEAWRASRRRSFSVRKRADEWRQFPPLDLKV